MSGHLRIYAELRGYGARGPRYQVRMNRPDGMVIVDATVEPLLATARLLLSRGITGKLQLWDSVRPFCRLQGDIERLAQWTVAEDQNGIGLRKYVERTADGDFEPEPSDSLEIEIGRPARAVQASSSIRKVAA